MVITDPAVLNQLSDHESQNNLTENNISFFAELGDNNKTKKFLI